MTAGNENLLKLIRSASRSVLADRRVDLDEAKTLLEIANRYAPENPGMADFAEVLKGVLADGVVDAEESERLELYLKWLSREMVAAEPERGFLGRFFGFNRNRTTVKAELVAGLTTFMTMAYILAVCPNILSQAGVPAGGVFVATVGASLVGTLLMAFLANYPFALAPGMGDIAFFAFSVVLGMGYSWQFALLAVFVDGLVFLSLSLLPVREQIFNAIPFTLKKALAAGIGLFICFIAFQNTGIIVARPSTLVQMIPFSAVPFHTVGIKAVLAIAGVFLTAVMMRCGWKGAMLLGIVATWVIGMGCQAVGLYVQDAAAGCASLYPSFSFSGLGEAFRQFGQTFGAIFDPSGWSHTVGGETVGSGWSLVRSFDFVVVVLAFLFVDLFNTLGTLIGVAMKGGFLTREGRLPNVSGALCADAIATSVGAVLGAPTTTTYVESASGVMAGGRTGFASVCTAALFLLSLVFAPVFLSVPAFATAPALIIVGCMMMSTAVEIDFSDLGEAVPAFLTIAVMPFSYSIADGIMAGVVSYTFINLFAGRAKRVHWIMYVLTAVFIAKYAFM